MNYLNTLIDTVEDNLENEIDYNKLAKLLGTSSYTMQRIFNFLTGITLTEYIRKRRLSKSAEELRGTNHKIIDIAVKYHYDSPVSFSNAFKKMFGMSPAVFRKNSNIEIVYFPRLEINFEVKGINGLEYRVVEMEEQTFYGKTTGIISDTDKKAIRNLYVDVIKDGTMDYIRNSANGKALYYGLYHTIYENGNKTKKGKYYILGEMPHKDFVKIKLPKAKWACFKLPNHKQDDILELSDNIYDNWLPESEYNLVFKYLELEIYYEDYCEICVQIK